MRRQNKHKIEGDVLLNKQLKKRQVPSKKRGFFISQGWHVIKAVSNLGKYNYFAMGKLV